ncbi:hypothetical protein [Natronorarus salvus]|uniref:hypothetical protein n=1 Tax=Natronorarus salvus TaxID=3117733 RepID=UPI002F26C212
MAETDLSPRAVCPLSVACRLGGERWRRSRDRRSLVEFVSENPDVDLDSLDGLSTISVTDGDADPGEVLETVRAIASAGLLPLTYDDDRFEGLNRLVAWLLSAGHVESSSHVPYFEIHHGMDYERLDRAFVRIGHGYERAEATSNGSSVVRPREAASALGRVFLTLGVPEGPHSSARRLPPYLERCPPPLRTTFAHVYLNNRGREREGAIEVVEEGPEDYRRALAALFGEVCDAPVSVVDDRIVLSPIAVGRLRGRLPS